MNAANNECPTPAITIPQETEEKRQFWEGEVKRWKASGQTQRVYGQARGLPKNQLSYWIQKLEPAKPAAKKQKSPFTPIRMKQEMALPYIRIKRSNGTCIELPLLSDMRQLKALLEVLEC